jgi:hypothetical protein
LLPLLPFFSVCFVLIVVSAGGFVGFGFVGFVGVVGFGFVPELPKALYVDGPTMPSAVKPWSFWNLRTA